MSQLEMVWPERKLNQPPSWTMPEGYSLRAYRHGDNDAYIALMRQAGFDYWNSEHLNSVLQKALPEGIFFIIHNETGTLVATAVATHNPSSLHPEGGELGWVAGKQEHSGRGLGYIVCAAVTRQFIEAGYSDIYLKTDDFRLPAIKIYLKLGWIPFCYEEEMKKCWDIVISKLNVFNNNKQLKG